MSQKMTYAEKREMRKRSKRTQAHEDDRTDRMCRN